MVTSKDLPQW